MNTPSPASHSRDVENFFYTNRLPQYQHPNIRIGDHTYGLPIIRLMPMDVTLTIGKFCSIAPDVTFLMGGNHRVDWVSTYPFAALKSDWPTAKGEAILSKGNVVVGNDVWLGTGAMIMSGVTIGDGAVIGARAIITKDVPPYAIIAGNPGKIIRKRFDDTTIAALLETQWWNWDIDILKQNAHLFSSEDARPLLKFYKEKIQPNLSVEKDSYATI